jgi:hypothetical protein
MSKIGTKKRDILFSKQIKDKYDVNGFIRCYTCGAVHPRSEIEAGHYKSRRYINTRWDEMNVKPQCIMCNRTLRGNVNVFRNKLIEEYGLDAVVDLEARAKKIKFSK